MMCAFLLLVKHLNLLVILNIVSYTLISFESFNKCAHLCVLPVYGTLRITPILLVVYFQLSVDVWQIGVKWRGE